MAGPWGQWHGLQRLRWLPALPETTGPHGVHLGPDPSTTQFLEAFRSYAMQQVDPELIADREAVWNILGDAGPDFGDGSRQPPGDWWCLRASDELHDYRGLLMRDLQCDVDSVSYFVKLVRCGKPEGYLDALRIIHHFLKDKDYPSPYQDPQGPDHVRNSRWLKNACLEALDALQNPEDWEQGPEENAKGASKGRGRNWGPSEAPSDGQGYSSASSSRTSRSMSRRTGWRG